MGAAPVRRHFVTPDARATRVFPPVAHRGAGITAPTLTHSLVDLPGDTRSPGSSLRQGCLAAFKCPGPRTTVTESPDHSPVLRLLRVLLAVCRARGSVGCST